MVTSPSRCFLLDDNSHVYFPFGNTRGRNILQDFNCEKANVAGENFIKILFLGCGDLRNMLRTAAAINPNNDVHLDIHLNDINPSIVARNILMLQIISAQDFNTDDEEDIAFLWDLWYNAEWPESTRTKFKMALKKLMDGMLAKNLSMSGSSSESLQKVWNAWYSICFQTETQSKLLREKIVNERSAFIRESWETWNPVNKSHVSSLSAVVDMIVTIYIGTNIAKGKLSNSVQEKLLEEVKAYFLTGSCRQQKENTFVCVNPTLLDPTTQLWRVHHTLSPFASFLPFTREELDVSGVVRSCQKILKSQIAAYRRRIETLNIFFHIGDALELCFRNSSEKFDVIDSSNLADHVGLANLISVCSKTLVDNSEAILLTESLTWETLAPSVLQYVEEALCSPLNMIPTMYGLRLADRIELGKSILTNISWLLVPAANLVWQKAPAYQLIVLHPSPSLDRCLNRLSSKCFLLSHKKVKSEEQRLSHEEVKSKVWCGMMAYSPLTFIYVVDSITQRVGGQEWLTDTQQRTNIPLAFNLFHKTTNAWKNGDTVLKLTAEIEFKTAAEITFLSNFKKTRSKHVMPGLRLILAPLTLLSIYMKGINYFELFEEGLYDGPDAHFIDNLQLEMKTTRKDEIEKITFSFLLMPDHDLAETHFGLLIEIATGTPIAFIESLNSLQTERVSLPYPFLHKRSPISDPSGKIEEMKVDSCVEFEEQYVIKLMIKCKANVISGVKVSTNQHKPCKSAHEITLSLDQPKNMRQLTLSFPYPFLVDNVRTTLHRKGRFIELVLTKAFLEPWPCEFQAKHNKFLVESLKPWEENEANRWSVHLGMQFNLTPKPSLVQTPILDEVRELIKAIFVDVMKKQHDFIICIQQKGIERPDWYFRCHRPLRISSQGTPVLMLSALNEALVKRLVKPGTLEAFKHVADFGRIFRECMGGANLTLWVTEPRVFQLWEFVLRLNSTKTVPSSWQKKNLPLGDGSPWLATYISPLYNTCAAMDSLGFDKLTMPSNAKEQKCCAGCNMNPLNPKRCSRCRATIYCSVQCQRKHWPQHKVVCSSSK